MSTLSDVPASGAPFQSVPDFARIPRICQRPLTIGARRNVLQELGRPVRADADALRIGAHRGRYGGVCVTGKPLRPLTSPVMTMLPSRAPVGPAYDCTA